MRYRFVPVWVSALALTAAACGSDDDGGGGGENVPLSEVPARYAASLCQALEACFGTDLNLLLGAEDCVKRFGDQLDDGIAETQKAIDDGKLRYDGTKVGACLTAIESAACNAIEIAAEDECQAALDGLVEIGGDCDSDMECAGSAYCSASGSCPGTCTERGQVGASCDGDGECAPGLACATTDGRCYQPAAAGDLCGPTAVESCDLGLVCVGANQDTNQPGNCRTYSELLVAKLGDSCDLIEGPYCEPHLSCVIESFSASGAVMTCQERVQSGAACKPAGPDMCGQAEYCQVVAGTLDGTCTKLPGDGEPCGAEPFNQTPSLCAAYTRCDGGTCRALAGLGQSCGADEVCHSENCSGGVCKLGGSCN